MPLLSLFFDFFVSLVFAEEEWEDGDDDDESNRIQ